jgi:hypothetical protein
MDGSAVFVSPPACWAPGLATPDDWHLWAANKKQIERTNSAPVLEYTDPLFRRRLSQLCRMTIEVVHDQLELSSCGDIKQIFVSCRGEINREFTINRQLISEGLILPAAFSLSVFNAPVGLASLAFKLKSGYSVIFPSRGNFRSALEAAGAPVLSGHEKQILFVYGDELVPEDYGDLRPKDNDPFAFAVVISSEKKSEYSELKLDSKTATTPSAFLKTLLRTGN